MSLNIVPGTALRSENFQPLKNEIISQITELHEEEDISPLIRKESQAS